MNKERHAEKINKTKSEQRSREKKKQREGHMEPNGAAALYSL